MRLFSGVFCGITHGVGAHWERFTTSIKRFFLVYLFLTHFGFFFLHLFENSCN